MGLLTYSGPFQIFEEAEVYQKILAPLDGSKIAECTLEHVKEVARGCNVPEVDFLFVVDISPMYFAGEMPPPVDLLMEAEKAEETGAREYLDGLIKKMKGESIRAKAVVLKGNPAGQILDFAEKSGVDLIVMSTHGRSGPSRFFLGSVAEKVLRASTVPVMVITPPGCKIG